jgi:uncharacterized membrane protein
MILASLNETDNVYRLLVVLHVLTVIVGFGSTFVYPFTGNYASKHPGLEAKGISNASVQAGDKLTEPAIIASGVLGVVLVLVGPYEFGDLWVGLSTVLFVAALVFSLTVHIPNIKAMDALINELADMGPPPGAGGADAGPPPGGPPPQVVEMEARGKAAARNGGILHLAFAVILVLMVVGARGGFA